MSCLYLIAHPQGWRKVGRAADPVRRLRQHQGHSGEPLIGEAIFLTDDSRTDERKALTALRPYRVMGEWFLLDKETAIAAIKAATMLNVSPFPDVRHLRPPHQSNLGPFARLYKRMSQDDPYLTVSGLNRLLADDLNIWIEEAIPAERRDVLLSDADWLSSLRQRFLDAADAAERRQRLAASVQAGVKSR